MSAGAVEPPFDDALTSLAALSAEGVGQLYGCRLERKLVASPEAAAALRAAVAAHMAIEQYVPGRTRTLIHSIYFDTSDFQLYRRSLESGPAPSMKLRMRAYGDAETPDRPDASRFLEAKISMTEGEGPRLKRKARIAISQKKAASLLGAGGWHKVKRISGRKVWKPLLAYMTEHEVRPRLTVSYAREAWVDARGTLRVTFDEGYRASVIGPDGASPLDAPAGCIGDAIVVEIKFTDVVPDWLVEALSALGLPPEGQTFSKFKTAVPLLFPQHAPRR